MKLKLIAAIMILCGMAIAQESKQNTAELAASSAVTPCLATGADANSQHECEKRDTARLFLLVGQPEAALRILCNTRTAIEVFRPGGALGSDKYEEYIAGNHRCLAAVGIEKQKQ